MFLFLLNLKGEVQDNTEVGRSMAQPNAAGELNAVALETALLEAWDNAHQLATATHQPTSRRNSPKTVVWLRVNKHANPRA